MVNLTYILYKLLLELFEKTFSSLPRKQTNSKVQLQKAPLMKIFNESTIYRSRNSHNREAVCSSDENKSFINTSGCDQIQHDIEI